MHKRCRWHIYFLQKTLSNLIFKMLEEICHSLTGECVCCINYLELPLHMDGEFDDQESKGSL